MTSGATGVHDDMNQGKWPSKFSKLPDVGSQSRTSFEEVKRGTLSLCLYLASKAALLVHISS